jgi:hypothetical protein
MTVKRRPNSALTVAQVLMIREKDANGEYTHPCSYWARLMMVNGETVRRARSGETWGWLDKGIDLEAPTEAPKLDDIEEIARSQERLKKLLEDTPIAVKPANKYY